MVKKHKNLVIVQAPFKSVEAVKGSAVVTKGQPYDEDIGYELSDDGILVIAFTSGRKKSKPVAQEFISRSGGNGHTFAPYGGGIKPPKELNFAFQFSVEWEDGSSGVLNFGQGSTAFRNNWHLGSTQMEPEHPSLLTTPNGTKLRVEGATSEELEAFVLQFVMASIPDVIKNIIVKLVGDGIEHFTKEVNIFSLSPIK